mmetsp:Transcript_5/g.12  ORF Transcript_5/g.12 Transcript_5/m.12 type:complete len:94 (+) Transcript_5:661-942(+)
MGLKKWGPQRHNLMRRLFTHTSPDWSRISCADREVGLLESVLLKWRGLALSQCLPFGSVWEFLSDALDQLLGGSSLMLREASRMQPPRDEDDT